MSSKKYFRSSTLLSAQLIIFSFQIDGKEEEQPLCEIGNFALLRASQQPGPLISFEEDIIERNQVQVLIFGDDYIGKKSILSI
jgi:hypothetical protein